MSNFGKIYNYQIKKKKKIFPSQPFIISGRPGTGKTSVILAKLFSIYYFFYLKKEKRKQDIINLKRNNNILNNEKKFTSHLRIVFTSFSQELFKEQKKSFVHMVKNVNFNI